MSKKNKVKFLKDCHGHDENEAGVMQDVEHYKKGEVHEIGSALYKCLKEMKGVLEDTEEDTEKEKAEVLESKRLEREAEQKVKADKEKKERDERLAKEQADALKKQGAPANKGLFGGLKDAMGMGDK